MQFFPFSTLPPLIVSLSWKIKTSVWQNHREIQGHKHVIRNPENPFSELEALKGWILQGSLLRVLDMAKNKADRAEKPLWFKQSIAEPLNQIQLRMGLHTVTRHILFSSALQQHPPPHLCHTAAALLSTAVKASAALPWPPQTNSPFSGRIICSSFPLAIQFAAAIKITPIKQDLRRKTKLTEVQTIAEIKVSYSNIHKITVHNREHVQWTWKTGH